MKLSALAAAVVFLTLSTNIASAQTSTPMPLQTKLDDNFKSIIENFGVALIRRLPLIDKSSTYKLSESTNTENGFIAGEFELVFANENEPAFLTSQGSVDIQMSRVGEQTVELGVNITGRLTPQELLGLLESLNQSLCTSSPCEYAPVTQQSDKSLGLAEQVGNASQRLKANIKAYLEKAAEPPSSGKRTITFGRGSASAPTNSSSIDAGLAKLLNGLLDQTLVVDTQPGQSAVNVNMEGLKGVGGELSKINPMLPFLLGFESIQFSATDAEVTYALSLKTRVPVQVIASYDAYMAQEQSRPNGLSSLADLVNKMAVWAVGRCSNEQYTALCMDKLLISCTKDVGRVGSCVGEAASVQAAREASANGDILGAGLSTAGAVTSDLASKAQDGFSGLINMITGNNQENEESTDPK